MVTSTVVIDAWNAVNAFLPLGTLVGLILAGAVVAYGLRVGLGIFRSGIGRR